MAAAAGLALRFVLLNLGATGLLAVDSTETESHLLLFDVDLDDLELVLHAGFQAGVASFTLTSFGDMAESFDALGDFNERAKLGGAQNLAVDYVAYAVRSEEALPDIGLELLDAEREAAILRLDAENN